MKTKTQVKTASRKARHNRIRSRVIGSAVKPRLTVYKSNTALYAQLIDDDSNTTLVASDTRKLKGENLVARATILGETIAKLAKDKSITTVVFDRGGFRYQGAVAAVADGARSGGLKF
jgi:large subunit ribosomal protein L18